ncbi:splicing regulatory glutamine/lysine-rich protein 1-like isoform X2 [Pezoporus flaviventris]|uniref:splicing regulatory glutamine/lysine-rich protein 1-like isoform X2 n=2 Tax=Pezoporus flaviventris TaxID=889875 RepID=UPI002AB0B6EE|nr:splicing regulatory glutamine/lysine-rich protein 1-like isoform X2 [Pezoporus flaviventris]
MLRRSGNHRALLCRQARLSGCVLYHREQNSCADSTMMNSGGIGVPLGFPLGPTSVIQVTNLSSAVTSEQMRTLFGFLGDIEELRLYPPDNAPLAFSSKVCYIKFREASSVGVAQHLTNTVFIDRALIVVPCAEGKIPDEAKALSLLAPAPAMTSLMPGAGLLPIPTPTPLTTLSVSLGNFGAIPAAALDPNIAAPGEIPQPPIMGNVDPSKIDEIRRTVYVGNLNSQTTTADQLLEFFKQVGEVKFVRMAGDETQPTRFAFVEFADQNSVPRALAFNGVMFGDRPLKINHSNNAIVKPPEMTPQAAAKELEEVMKRVREAQSFISAAIEPESGKSSERKGGRSRSHSRSESRSSSKSRSRRKRSHSKHRSRSGNRSLLGHKDRLRSRSPRKKRSMSRERWKSRSHSRGKQRDKEKVKGKEKAKEKAKERDRDKEKERNQDKEWERERNKERNGDKDKEKDREREKEQNKDRERVRDKDRDKDREKNKDKKEKDREEVDQNKDKDDVDEEGEKDREKIKDKEGDKERGDKDNDRDKEKEKDEDKEKKEHKREKERDDKKKRDKRSRTPPRSYSSSRRSRSSSRNKKEKKREKDTNNERREREHSTSKKKSSKEKEGKEKSDNNTTTLKDKDHTKEDLNSETDKEVGNRDTRMTDEAKLQQNGNCQPNDENLSIKMEEVQSKEWTSDSTKK